MAASAEVLVAPDGGALLIRGLSPATPIVMPAMGDPVRSGYTQSLSPSKRLELFKEAVPGLQRVGALFNAARPVVTGGGLAVTRAAADALGVAVVEVQLSRPADLPIEQATRFELVVSLKTAKTLGITIPQSILLRADTLIE